MASDRDGGGRWLPYLGLITLVAGIVYQTGQSTRDLADARNDVNKLELRVTKLEEMNNRLTRIETKIDILVPDSARGSAK